MESWNGSYMIESDTQKVLVKYHKFGSDPSLSQYGFYSAKGPTYIIDQGCPNTEIPGPNINITQFFQQQGCTFTIQNGTWLVIDMSG